MSIFFYRLTCPNCHYREVISRHEAQRRLQAAKKLRGNLDSDEALLDELVPTLLGQLTCPQCGMAAVHVATQEDRDDWNDSRKCAACGKAISPARLAILPDVELCAACQSAVERGETPGPPVYCRWCGHPMKLLPRQIGGLTRYVWVCTKVPPCRNT